MEKRTEEIKHVPIVIGNYYPFRLVFRDIDKWEPSLEDINNRTYDYVRLNRISTFIDVGITPFSLGIGFDGSLVLPASKEFRCREDALEKFNETLGIFLLGGVYCESMLPTDISYGTLTFDGYAKIHGGGSGAASKFHHSIRTKLVGTLEVMNLYTPQTISIIDLENAYLEGKKIFQRLTNLTPNMLLNGTSHFVRHLWAESLIFLWTSIEQVVNVIWKKEIVDINIGDMVEGRSKFLKDFRTWTTSTRIEVLYQKGLVNIEVYKLLNSARKSRNDFIHNGGKLNQEKVKPALDALFKLISLFITEYNNSTRLDKTLEIIYRNQRGDLYPQKSVLKMDEVTHWLAIPPIPGDINWGDKEYERIEEITLYPLSK